jgi:N-acetylmuramic acid 6-phosphate etherase
MSLEKRPDTPFDLTGLQTESTNAQSTNLDRLSTLEIVSLMNREDLAVMSAVNSCLDNIATAVDDIYPRISQGGRLFYVGSGTSGRLGLLDAAEIPPTFSAPVSQFVAIISGGDEAIRIAQEGAEDSKELAISDLQSHNLTSIDTVIGIASSGRTPYVIGALKYAQALGCLTVGICCVSPSRMQASGVLDHLITPVTGSEIVTGSTRLKAGTATKMTLNMLSTTVMVKLGKTYGNLVSILAQEIRKFRPPIDFLGLAHS